MNATGKDMLTVIDKEATLSTADGLSVAVKVLNVRSAFGRIDLEVTPLSGHGKAWVSASRVKVNK